MPTPNYLLKFRLLHFSQTSSGMIPKRMRMAKKKHPAHHPTKDSKEAKKTSIPNTTLYAVHSPNINNTIDVIEKPNPTN